MNKLPSPLHTAGFGGLSIDEPLCRDTLKPKTNSRHHLYSWRRDSHALRIVVCNMQQPCNAFLPPVLLLAMIPYLRLRLRTALWPLIPRNNLCDASDGSEIELHHAAIDYVEIRVIQNLTVHWLAPLFGAVRHCSGTIMRDVGLPYRDVDHMANFTGFQVG